MAVCRFSTYREHVSDGSCSMVANIVSYDSGRGLLYPGDEEDEHDNQVHVHENVQYSVDPNSGKPLALVLKTLDPCTMFNFTLNRRLCSVSTVIGVTDIHVVEFAPKNAIQFWTVVASMLKKWDDFNREEGYWPSFCTVTDAVVNPDWLDGYRLDGDEVLLRSMRPVHFINDSTSFAAAMDRLVCVWFENYYRHVLSVTNESKLREILSGGISNESFVTAGGGCVKARRIECDPRDHAAGFWERYDTEKYKECFTTESGGDWSVLKCRLKQIMDSAAAATTTTTFRNGRAAAVAIDYDADPDDELFDTPTSVVNAERLRSKRLFHAIVVDTFGNHREYPHVIMCREFIVQNRKCCDAWLKLLRVFSEYRLRRLTEGYSDDREEEDAKSGIRLAMKDWNSRFPPLSVSTKLREKDLKRLSRKKRKNDTIARKLVRLVES